jgi:hypothetical protein
MKKIKIKVEADDIEYTISLPFGATTTEFLQKIWGLMISLTYHPVSIIVGMKEVVEEMEKVYESK